jgi:hypothetical protein
LPSTTNSKLPNHHRPQVDPLALLNQKRMRLASLMEPLGTTALIVFLAVAGIKHTRRQNIDVGSIKINQITIKTRKITLIIPT